MDADFDNIDDSTEGTNGAEIELLQGLLADLRELANWARQDGRDLDDMELRAADDLDADAVSPLGYAVDMEAIRRGRDVIVCCLRDYERQHKLALHRLIELRATTK